MNWTLFSLHFRQDFDGGYRYLDRFGEFLLAAESSLDFIPTDAKPTGGKLEIPESGISVEIDAMELKMTQDRPDDRGTRFAYLCGAVSELARQYFEPQRITRNGAMSKWIESYPSEEAALDASLALTQALRPDLDKAINMTPLFSVWHRSFESGSWELRIQTQLGSFEFTNQRRIAGIHDSASQKKKVERFNKKASRVPNEFRHCLILDIDLMEFDPAEESSVQGHFGELEKYEKAILSKLSIGRASNK
ncbi:MAG TPA: hypothetical protein VHY22_18880 [Chthoniobacteraceae bacterium]|jgi:hypothetical protein|nr:hypothetical protein [Chthoniobacteraceae bacterium]